MGPAPPKLADMGVGAERDGASLTVSLTEQGKEDASPPHPLLWEADCLCSQERCQLWSASSLADGSVGTQGESSAVCTFL